MALDRSIVEATLAAPYGEAAYKVCEALLDAGFEALFVGGAVRDMLMSTLPSDIDIATSATPEQMGRVFPAIDNASAAFGSVRVRLRHHTFDVTTFRSDDSASDGRHPESVTFGTLEDDAKRRDFTVNALYFNPVSRTLHDPFGGVADLREKLVRFIGDPSVRIAHDALRILRAVRLRALLGGQYHPATYAALKKGADLVKVLSGERLRLELEKILCGRNAASALEDLWELDILERIAPELNVCKGIPQPADYHHEGDVWEHLLSCVRAFRESDSPDIRWAALLHDIGKAETFSLQERIRFDHHATVSAHNAETLLQRFQMPSARIRKISWLIAHHMMMGSFSVMPEERKGHWYYHPWFPDLLRVMELDIAGTEPSDDTLLAAIVKDMNAFLDRHPRPQKPLLDGNDVMEILSLQPGAEVGRMLQLVDAAQQRGEITTTAEAKDFLLRGQAPS